MLIHANFSLFKKRSVSGQSKLWAARKLHPHYMNQPCVMIPKRALQAAKSSFSAQHLTLGPSETQVTNQQNFCCCSCGVSEPQTGVWQWRGSINSLPYSDWLTVLTKATLPLPFSAGQRERLLWIFMEGSWGELRAGRDHSPVTRKTDSTQGDQFN